MTNAELAKTIVDLLGGKENVVKTAHCMTRLRVTCKDKNQVHENEIKNTEGVLGFVAEGNNYQIVLGPGKVKKVTDICIEELGLPRNAGDGSWEANKEQIKNSQKQSKVRDFMKLISEIFVPMIPAIIAAGLFNGFGSLLSQLMGDGVVSGGGFVMLQLILSLLGSAFLGYFAIYTGIRAAEVFGATPAFGGILGGISIGANIVEISRMIGLYNEEVPLESILTTGKGGIIGVIFGVWILSVIEKNIRKRVPDVLDLIVTPFTSLLISGIVFIFIIMPAAGFVSDGLVSVLTVIINSSNPVIRVASGFLLAALFLPMVLLGLHHGLIPIYAVQLEQMGGVSLFPVLAMGGAGQVGAAIAIYLTAKKVGNNRMKGIITGALPAGFLGVGEPLIYGVTLPMGKPFITAGIGAGFGGAYVMLTQVMANAWGPSGLVAIPLMQGTSGMLNFLIGLVIAYGGGFLVTKIFIKDEDVLETENSPNTEPAVKKTGSVLYAPVDGDCIPVSEVNDSVFSSRMMGDGVAFRFEGSQVCAPCDGKICMIAETKHAFGMVNDDGVEVIIHIGLDTVNLNGQGFTVLVKKDQIVKKGTPVIELNQEFFKSKGIDLTTPMIVTNGADMEIEIFTGKGVEKGNTVAICCRN
ncbi:MAG: glucose PTS transporter subunit IIA [Lachnospiraceae bacterium]|nr:glucose PTS transporter subunit IIA [Lachnospiraceae bacterium]